MLAGGRRVIVKLVRLGVEAVALDWKGSPVVVLRETKGQRAVFIWVGMLEATSISMQIEKQRPPRPITHDLILLMLGELSAKVSRVVITDMRDMTYYADLHLVVGDKTSTIDCRPSDAIAIALRAKAPIQIEEKLLERLDKERKETEVEVSGEATFADSGETTVH